MDRNRKCREKRGEKREYREYRINMEKGKRGRERVGREEVGVRERKKSTKIAAEGSRGENKRRNGRSRGEKEIGRE